MLHDLAVYALGVLALCCARAAVRTGLTTLFGRLCPGPRPRRLRWRLVAAGWVLVVTLRRRP